MYIPLALFFLTVLVVGSLLTLKLFNFDIKAIQKTELDKKILMWIPIGIIVLLILRFGFLARLLVFGMVIILSIFEFYKLVKKQNIYLNIFFLLFILGLITVIMVSKPVLFIYLIVGTVLSDVGGFFMGSYFGKHKLPECLNNKKSWEGVGGQLLGAFIGVLILKYFVLHIGNLIWFLPIGFGSAVGDLANSRAKRILGVKNWSKSIPGHGGYIDRFCSLAGSSVLIFLIIYTLSSFGV